MRCTAHNTAKTLSFRSAEDRLSSFFFFIALRLARPSLICSNIVGCDGCFFLPFYRRRRRHVRDGNIHKARENVFYGNAWKLRERWWEKQLELCEEKCMPNNWVESLNSDWFHRNGASNWHIILYYRIACYKQGDACASSVPVIVSNTCKFVGYIVLTHRIHSMPDVKVKTKKKIMENCVESCGESGACFAFKKNEHKYYGHVFA